MNLKKINSVLLAAAALIFSLAPACFAAPAERIMGEFTNSGTAAGFPVTPKTGVPKIEFGPAWIRYIDGLLILMGSLFMVNILYAGYLWMMAQGKEEQVERAKHLIINSSIGLGVIIGARLIVEIVLFYLGQTIK